MNGKVFVVFVRGVLVPTLEPGRVVILDRLGAYCRAEVRELVEVAGCELEFLLSYSPDFNPVELALAWLKVCLRSVGECSWGGLLAAMGRAGRLVDEVLAGAWLAGCGYLA